MDFNEVIYNRRTARLFTNTNVSDEDLQKIISSGAVAPSARNRQPWKFYILNNKQKNDITSMLFEWDKNNPNEKTSVKGSALQIKSSNRMILIYTNKYKTKDKNIFYKKPDYLSLGCVLENMSLQAVNLGLGSCILCDTLYIEKQIDLYLGIKNLEHVCGFIVGKPIYNYPPKIKKDLKDILLKTDSK